MSKVKENLFTLHGLITSVIHGLIIVGALASYVYFQVSIMGNDVAMETLSSVASKKR